LKTDSTKPRCPKCGSKKQVVERCSDGPRYGKLVCGRCGHFLGWAPSPMTLERAQAFVMPLGKFEGKTLRRIAKDGEGRHYLRWLNDQEWVASNIRAAIEMVLGTDTAVSTTASQRDKRPRGDGFPKKTDPKSTCSDKPSSRKAKAQHSTKRQPKGEARR
jgi:hypothetical protein